MRSYKLNVPDEKHTTDNDAQRFNTVTNGTLSEAAPTGKKSFRRFLLNVIWELVAMFISIMSVSLLKYSNHFEQFLRFSLLLVIYWGILFGVSVFFKKYEYKQKSGFYAAIDKYFKSWLIATAFFISLIYMMEIQGISRKWILIGYGGFFVLEVILVSLRYAYRNAVDTVEKREVDHLRVIHHGMMAEEEVDVVKEKVVGEMVTLESAEMLDEFSLKQINNPAIRQLIIKQTDKPHPRRLLLHTFSRFNLLPHRDKSLDQIVNLSRINRVRFINKFHETAYIKLRAGGLYFVCTETLDQRLQKFHRKLPPVISHIYWIIDFLIHRVSPRLPYIRKAYFLLWRNWNKPLSYAESLGRLYSCGFELIEEKVIDHKYWFVMRKSKRPSLNYGVTYGPMIRLSRTGKGGKPIKVYKLRTMHPFSEYLQELVMKRNNLAEGGKFKNDFRVSSWGRFLRKTWLDELPMIANLLRGDLKIVGVRPLSKHYLSLYPIDFQQKRTTVKPGLIPPFYADMPKTLEEIIASENRYIDAYQKNCMITDVRYFRKAFCNIVIKRKRSR